MKRFAVILLGILACSAPARADDARLEAVVAAAAKVASGWTAELREATRVLAAASDTLCRDPVTPRLQAAQAAFGKALDAWEKVAVLPTGPVAEGTRAYRFMFWPDRRGQTARQMTPLLANEPAELTPQRLAGASAAVQGLPAMEFLLFGDEARRAFVQGEGRAARCAMLAGTATNLATLADTVATEWQGTSDPITLFVDRSAPSAPKAAANVLFTLILDTLAVADEQKLGLPLGKTVAAAQPRQAESWRSGRSVANIAINVKAVRTLVEVGGDASLARAAGADYAGVTAAFSRADAALAAANAPLDTAVAEAKQRLKVIAARTAIRDLREQIVKAIPEKLGLSVGFNAMDGD